MCPLCLSVLAADARRCPTCGFDIESRLQRPSEIDLTQARLPPEQLVYRVMSVREPEQFLYSGHRVAEDFVRAVAWTQRPLPSASRILDFGAGCGRLLRWLMPKAPSADWHACDTDHDAIAWVAANVPAVDARATQALPPLPYADNAFDLIIGYSVFTHLPEEYQDAWLAELHRIARPEALVLLTVHGTATFSHAATRQPFLGERAAEFERGGFIYWANGYWKDEFPAYYQTAYHHPDYVRRHWSRWFKIVAILGGVAHPRHDIVIARRRADPVATAAPGS